MKRKLLSLTLTLAVVLALFVPFAAVSSAADYPSLRSYFKGIDTASTSTVGYGSEVPANLIDGNVGTKLFTADAKPIRIAFEMTRAVRVYQYSLTTANDTSIYPGRNPVSWTLYGSNDGTGWHQIDNVTNGGLQAVNYTTYTFNVDTVEAYQFFMIQINSTAGSGFQLSEIDLYGYVASATEVTKGVDLIKNYFTAVDTNLTSTVGYGSEVPQNLFDGDVTTKLFTADAKPISIVWDMRIPVTVYSYSLTTANDTATYSGRNPVSWVLYGSNNKSSWTTIDTVTNGGMQAVNFTAFNYTVDTIGSFKFFKLVINSTVGSGFQLSEVTLKGAGLSPDPYDLLFYGDWNMVTHPDYVPSLTELFKNVYPRLYKRFGNGTEPKAITFQADKNYDGIAYAIGTTVCVSVNYANSHPYDHGFFSHEITHSVQQYGNKMAYGDGHWWTENLANYGGFRYYHWGTDPSHVQIYKATDTSLQDWGYHPYGNNKWFFAYMDSKYPTTQNPNGTLNYGLIDSLHFLIKNNTGPQLTDDPYNPNTPFNQMVYQKTGYRTIEALRQKFVQDLQSGAWTFTGFGNYVDNFRTENIEGLKNPNYPMLGPKTHGSTTAQRLANPVTSGNNLMNGASLFRTSGFINSSEQASYLFDGNRNTKWCATSSNVWDATYALNGVAHFVMIDLGSVKTFNTYTIFNTQSKEGFGNATEWEVLISNDGINWTSIDYQVNQNYAISSYNVGTKSARYIFLKVFNPDNGGPGTVRLYEFELYLV